MVIIKIKLDAEREQKILKNIVLFMKIVTKDCKSRILSYKTENSNVLYKT